VLRSTGPAISSTNSRFQSSPGPEARCYRHMPAQRSEYSMFQSSPGPEARCYAVIRIQEHRPGVVSILTGPGGPVLRLGV